MILSRKSGTVVWLPVLSFGVAAVFLAAAFAGGPRLPAFRSTVYLLICSGVFFLGRGVYGVRWFYRDGALLVCRALLSGKKFPADTCAVAYRSGGFGFGGRFLEIVCLRVHPETGRPVPVDSFLAGWVTGFAQAYRLAHTLHDTTGIIMEGQLTHGPTGAVRKTDVNRLIIIVLALVALVLLGALLYTSGVPVR